MDLTDKRYRHLMRIGSDAAKRLVDTFSDQLIRNAAAYQGGQVGPDQLVLNVASLLEVLYEAAEGLPDGVTQEEMLQWVQNRLAAHLKPAKKLKME